MLLLPLLCKLAVAQRRHPAAIVSHAVQAQQLHLEPLLLLLLL